MNDPWMTHNDVELLLPWYVNDTLDDDERKTVQQHLQTCAECRDNVELLGRMKTAVHGRAPSPIVPKPRIEQMLATIDADAEPATPVWRKHIFSIAASIALLAITALAIYGGRSSMPNLPARFETATGVAAATDMEYVFEIKFRQNMSADDRHRILEKLGAREILFDDDAGVHRVIVRLPARSLRELEQFGSDLKKNGDIQSAEVVALQLPVGVE